VKIWEQQKGRETEMTLKLEKDDEKI